MALVLEESRNASNRDPLIGESYEIFLNQSIQNLLAEIRQGTPNYASFIQNFYELMQASVDPPLESIWVYSALSFRSRNAVNDDPLAQLSAAKDLFQLVSACSASCGSSKSVALLAPVVLEMYKLAVGCSGKDLASKRERKVMRGVKALLDAVLGHIGVCCCSDLNEESNLVMQFGDLVSIWRSGNEGLESFLHLVSPDICRELGVGGCDVGHLAGMVIVEAFLLKLSLSFRDGVSRSELEKELRTWAVGSITGFQNYYFLETLTRMLLESALPLPVTSLLGSENEVLLRKVLFDAVILVEYSFLNPERVTHVPVERMKSFAMTRLIVMHEAIEFFREVADQGRAISYSNAFSSSRLPYQIIKWVSSQIGMEAEASRSYGSSPKLLLKWLLSIEDQGIRIFDDSISKCRAKLVIDISRAQYEEPTSKSLGEKGDADIDFFIDNKGEEENGDEDMKMTNESMNAAFVAAAQTMKSTENGGRKRKEGKSVETKKRIKFLKYNLCDNSDSAKERSSPVKEDGSSSESEVENPLSDEDIETRKR